MARKNFVLDTNVLIHFPQAVYEFADNHVIIPIQVIEELDSVKTYREERARSAREASRELDKFRGAGQLSSGAPLPGGGALRIAFPDENFQVKGLSRNIADNEIILTALMLTEEQQKRPAQEREKVIFVTKDLNARIKADALGIETQDFEKQKVSFADLYSGYCEFPVSGDQVDSFYRDKALSVTGEDWLSNQFCTLVDQGDSKHTALTRHLSGGKLVPLLHAESTVWGIRARNREQRFALECLMDDSISLVALVGQAGTGKTLLALAAGLSRTMDAQAYKKMLVARPVMPLGKDIGYLPGTKDEKLHLWMQPIFDNLEFILSENGGDKYGNNSPEESVRHLVDRGLLELEALTYIRGRSISYQYFIVDEAQNLTPHEVKTIISRAGVGTKIVLTGDPYQIDNPYLDANSNGLTYSVEKLKDSPLFASVTLTTSERSELASLAAENL